ncbi:hypothetical protein CHUAL_005335 [Chamberlinius hualienensis]
MWTHTSVNKKYGVVIYSFDGNVRHGISLGIGETVQVIEEFAGWFRGFPTRNKSCKGIFPASHIHIKPCEVENEGQYEIVTPLEDPTIKEITSVLREWGGIWKGLFVKQQVGLFGMVRQVMRELIEWRKQLLCGTLTQDQIRDLRAKVSAKIDYGNRKLGLDLVPRVDNEMVDGESISVVELYRVHLLSSENTQNASSRGTTRRKESKSTLIHHLYFCMRDFGYNVGEDTDVYFSVYDAKEAKFISERFLVRISKDGFSNYVERLQSNAALFTDLGNGDLNRELYLIAHVMRIGRMVYSESSKRSSSQAFKRPHGCAVLPINEILHDRDPNLEDKEFTMKVYLCSESDFYQLHELVIRRHHNRCNQLSGQSNYGIVVSLKLLHGVLSQVQQENPLLFKNVALTHKIGFSDVIMPGDVRNDLYLTLDRGEFEKGGKSTGKNIEVTACIVDNDGSLLEKCINIGSGIECVTEYQSVIFYHSNAPRWCETIRLAIPIEKYSKAHIRLELRHCSTRDKSEKKLFGFAFSKLMDDDGTTIKDGRHELFVYKCDDRSRLRDPQSYLNLPWNHEDQEDCFFSNQFYQRSPKETIFINTMICSTKLTQNVDLLSLLKWKSFPNRIQDTLNKIMKLGGEEIVKFLQDILDALFGMFSTVDGSLTAHSSLVFQVLISIFGILDYSKFEQFRPVLDTYITGHFAAALVYKGLILCLKQYSDSVATTERQEPIQKCFRSLEYIFKFIVQSRILYVRASGEDDEDLFREDLEILFTSFRNMLSINADNVLSTQIMFLANLSLICDQLIKVIPLQETAHMLSTLLGSIPQNTSTQVTLSKLHCIRDFISGKLFQELESRTILLNCFTEHINFHISQRQELLLCADILGRILINFHKEDKTLDKGKSHSNQHEVQIIVLNVLAVLIQSVIAIEWTRKGQLVACLIALLKVMNEFHYTSLWEEFKSRKHLKEFLLNVFQVFHELVKRDVFPKDWMVMSMATNNVILEALHEFSNPLCYQFLQGADFDFELWNGYFNLAVGFLTQPSLQLETFSEVKKHKILEIYGDMRVLMGFQILAMWSGLGEHKIHFIPALVGPFLEVTLVPETELRKATLPIFYDMMDCEQRARGHFKQVESELIDKLDILVSKNKGDDEYRRLFNTMEHLGSVLLDRVKTDSPSWKDCGTAFINSVTRLLERLLDYRNVMDGDENRDKRMSCTVNLLNFYKNEIDRKEMYIRYIYKLRDLHIPAENYTEAAFTLKLHADQLSWSDRILPPEFNYPTQMEWQRKERLYLQIIDFFDRGKCWEKGIPLCKELTELYETKLFDYTNLSNVLRVQAKFFDNILTQLRPEPEYFRVGFYGMGFPLFLRNKLFIYRGLEYERIGAFTQRLQTEFPTAQMFNKNTPPDDSILISEEKYIQICNVRPIPEYHPEFSNRDVPEKILQFYMVNDVKTFQFDRPVHKGVVDKENEFKSLWIERTTLVTASTLPGILRWFEVVDYRTEELSPIEYACESVCNKNRELSRLISLYSSDTKHSNINPFSMLLQGIIDAAVMGGISKYQNAFFTLDFSVKNQPLVGKVEQLKELIFEQVNILEGGLALHGRLAPATVQPLQVRLVECFNTMKQSVKMAGSLNTVTLRRNEMDSIDGRKPSILNTPLPPIPVDGKKILSADSNSNRSSSSGSSVYGQLMPEDATSEDEDIYSKPMDLCDCPSLPYKISIVAPPLPPRKSLIRQGYATLPSRPKSAMIAWCTALQGFGTDKLFKHSNKSSDYSQLPARDRSEEDVRVAKGHVRSKTSSPKVLTKQSHSLTDCGRNSWSESCTSDETAPPLPPRGYERRATTCVTSLNDETPPALPKRLMKKTSAPSLYTSSDYLTVDISLDSTDSDQFQQRTSEKQSNDKTPPPIPLKRSMISPSTLLSPSTPSFEEINHRILSTGNTTMSLPTTPLISPANNLPVTPTAASQCQINGINLLTNSYPNSNSRIS